MKDRVTHPRRLSRRTTAAAAIAALGAGAATALWTAPADAAPTLPPGCSIYYDQVECTYTADTTFTVPGNLHSIDLTVTGGAGGGASTSFPSSGLGGAVGASVDVSPGQMLELSIGGDGSRLTGGVGGGGNGATAAGSTCSSYGGGGASTVSSGGVTLIVAAGGGGRGCQSGSTLGLGGNAGQRGSDGTAGARGGEPFGRGGDSCGFTARGGDGVDGQGGTGDASTAYAGGGGGGGYAGGGGGGSGCAVSSGGGFGGGATQGAGGGGAGGISYAAPGLHDVTLGGMDFSRLPRVTISFANTSAGVSAESVDFGTVLIGRSSDRETVDVTAHGGPVGIADVAITGPDADQFSMLDDQCTGTVLETDTSCSIIIAFNPSTAGASNATLSIATDAFSEAAPVSLMGIGHAKTGDLRIGGAGTTFTGSDHMVSLAVGGGSAASYPVKVVNRSSAQAQFLLRLTSPVGTPATVELFAGRMSVSPLAIGPDGYVTSVIAPGSAQTLTLKVTPQAGAPQGITKVNVLLFAMDRVQVDQMYTETNVKAPSKGDTAYDLFATSGNQPYIGGSFSGQATTAGAMQPTGSAKYTVRLANDTAGTASIGFHLVGGDCTAAFPVLVKDGIWDVTDAVLAGTYTTPKLGAGGSRNLAVTVRYQPNGSDCTAARWQAVSISGPAGSPVWFSYLNTNLVAS